MAIDACIGQRNMSCRLNTAVFTDNMQVLLHSMHKILSRILNLGVKHCLGGLGVCSSREIWNFRSSVIVPDAI